MTEEEIDMASTKWINEKLFPAPMTLSGFKHYQKIAFKAGCNLACAAKDAQIADLEKRLKELSNTTNDLME